MFGIGFSELLVIAVIALVFVGPKRMMELASELGKLWGRLQKELEQMNVKKMIEDVTGGGGNEGKNSRTQELTKKEEEKDKGE